MNCKWPIMELLLEWGIDNMFVALGNCYCCIQKKKKKHDIHRTSLSSQCENCEVVPPHSNVKSQKSKGTYNKNKRKAKQDHCNPHTGEKSLV